MLAIIMAIENDSDRDFVLNLYNRYSKKLYFVAYDVLKHRVDAEDCVHDTILKLVDDIDYFKRAKRGKGLKNLMMVVCSNIAKNKYSQNKRRSEAEFSTTVYDEEGYSEIMDIPDMSSDVERIVLSESNVEYIKTLVNQLDDIYRDLLILKSRGLENKKIAECLNISEALVRKRYSRARAKILEMGGDKLYEYCNGR